MKNLLKTKRAEGFTIIEVMIVLAIAGLIMVIVFIAVPQLQRNQRDNARQNITNRVKAEIETYAGNNQGVYPFGSSAHAAPSGACPAAVTGCITDFVNKYIDTAGAAATCNDATQRVNTCDPTLATPRMTGGTTVTGRPEAFGTAPCTANPALTHGELIVCYGARCNGEALAASGAATTSTRTFAVAIGLDRDGTVYCVDNG